MKYGIASDHAGFELKEELKSYLKTLGITVEDYGTYDKEPVDYPDYAHRLAHGITSREVAYGIAICGSGNGISMALNKHPEIRAALSWTPEIATLARAHNNANVLSLPARFISVEMAKAIVDAFLSTNFEGGRHTVRVNKIPLCN